MKLLIITQKVDINDDVLGFFHEWIRKFSEKFEKVTVICLKLGQCDLPGNVRVFSLGKERGLTRFSYLKNFYKFVLNERKNYDTVFVHMNPAYVIYGGLLWKLLGKKISLWYAHGRVDFKLRLADKITDIIFTSTADGYRLKNKKTKIVGQGIDTEKFKPAQTEDKKDFKIVSVGRISPSKDYETLIGAIKELKNNGGANFKIEIAGQPATEDDNNYLDLLNKRLKEEKLDDIINFIGPIPNKNLPSFLNSADLFVNMSQTGSLDKAVLEAMACGSPIFTCNEALKSVLTDYGEKLMYPKKDFKKLAEKIKWIIQLEGVERQKIADDLRAIVVKNHNLNNLIEKISLIINSEMLSDIGEIFDTKIREKYDGDYEYNRWFKNSVTRAGYEMTLKSIKEHFLNENFHFLDYIELGPGPGTWTKLFIEKNKTASFDLVDISSEMLKLAKNNLRGHQNIRYFESDFLDFKPDKNYDLFFSSRALEYIRDKESAVKKIADLLKSGGRGFIITKTPKYLRSRILMRQIPEIHRHQISPGKLSVILSKNQFRNIEIYPATMNFPLLHSTRLNKLLYQLLGGYKLNFINRFFAESYCIKFMKL